LRPVITTSLITSLLLILTLAWILGYLFSRLGLPALLGELLAGVILGPPLLGIIRVSEPIELLAELGIFFVMFHSGMEMDPKELLEHMWPSLGVAIGGFVVPFASGYLVTRLFGGTLYQSLFVGMGVSITAIAVQAIILYEMRINRTNLGHIIMGAAIVDDILALMTLSTLLSLVKTGTFQFQMLVIIFLKVTIFFGATILIGHFIMPRFTRRLTDQGGKAFTFAIASALTMGVFAELAGLHLIIGAFLAGQFVREEIMDKSIYRALNDRFSAISYGFLVPIFFASLAFHLHFSWQLGFIVFTTTLILVAVAGKLLGCMLGAVALGFNVRESAVIGLGMNGRGAIELVVASVVIRLSDELLKANVISAPLLTSGQFAGLVLMAFVTTLIAPVSLRWMVMRTCTSSERQTFCEVWDETRRAQLPYKA
jgi:Kef-type K+ transport system membrane component KefB